MLETIERIEQTTGKKVERVTEDKSYLHTWNYEGLQRREIEVIIPQERERSTEKRMPIRRFKHDGRHQIVTCPGDTTLERSSRPENG